VAKAVFIAFIIIGAVGFIVLAMMGMGHGHAGAGHQGHAAIGGHHALGAHAGHAGHVGQVGHAGHANAHAPAATHAGSGPRTVQAKAGTSPSEGASPQSTVAGALRSAALLFVSPLDLCSILLGAGLVGFVLQRTMAGNTLYLLAFLGGLLFDLAITRSMMALAFRFAGTPSLGLEGAVAQPVKAVTGFDHDGKGLVELILDGQSRQLLATLDVAEVQAGTAVHRGDALMILEVDPHRNICKVSRDLAPSEGEGPSSSSLHMP